MGGSYRKIDLYVNGVYECSTNAYKTLREAVQSLKNKGVEGAITAEFS